MGYGAFIIYAIAHSQQRADSYGSRSTLREKNEKNKR